MGFTKSASLTAGSLYAASKFAKHHDYPPKGKQSFEFSGTNSGISKSRSIAPSPGHLRFSQASPTHVDHSDKTVDYSFPPPQQPLQESFHLVNDAYVPLPMNYLENERRARDTAPPPLPPKSPNRPLGDSHAATPRPYYESEITEQARIQTLSGGSSMSMVDHAEQVKRYALAGQEKAKEVWAVLRK